MPHTFGAQVGIDNVDRIAFGDGFYGAYVDTAAAAGAIISDFVWHCRLLISG